MKIAIIGAGIFGTISAAFLAQSGHSVHLYESKSQILSGASGNNSNRLHLGFHYPRDLETAVQSRQGYEDFRKYFSGACNFTFPCIYALSREHSRTSTIEFTDFLESANLSATEIETNRLLNYGFNTSKISKAWSTQEGVIDISALKAELLKKLSRSGVWLNLNTEVKSISRFGRAWRLEYTSGEACFDLVVIATYGVDNLKLIDVNKDRSQSLFQATMILQAKIPAPQFGITVIDGDFITVLPKGFSDQSLIYAPKPSVLAQSNNLEEVIDSARDCSLVEGNAVLLKDRFKSYFPNNNVVFSDTKIITIRNIESSSTLTDRRVSRLEELAPDLFSIRSGKIDHAIEIAKDIMSRAQ